MQTSTRLCHAVIATVLLTVTASGVPTLVAARSSPPPAADAACPDPATGCAEASAIPPETGSAAGAVTLPEAGLAVPAITVPGGDVVVPGGTVTVPGGTVVVPGGTVTVPGGTVVVPGGTVTVPGGTVTVPGGTVTLPDATVPDVTVPDVTVPDLTIPDLDPGGDVTVPGGDAGPAPGGPPAGGPGELLWSADFEGGDLRGFDDTPWNQVGSGPPRIVGLGDGTKALALTIPAGGARNEVVPDMDSLVEGDDLYFGFSTHLAPGFPVDGPWQILAQWKNDGTGSPPVELKVERGRFLLDGGYGYPGGNRHFQVDLGPATTGQWANWVFHIRFSDDPGSGYVEVWRDGQQAAARVAPPGGTLYPGLDSYLKIGYYRNSGIGTAGTVIHDNWRIGTTYAAVSSADPAPAGGVAAPAAVSTAPAPVARSTAPTTTPTRTTATPKPTTTVTEPPAARPATGVPTTTPTPPKATTPPTPSPTSTTPPVTPSTLTPVAGAEPSTEQSGVESATEDTSETPAG